MDSTTASKLSWDNGKSDLLLSLSIDYNWNLCRGKPRSNYSTEAGTKPLTHYGTWKYKNLRCLYCGRGSDSGWMPYWGMFVHQHYKNSLSSGVVACEYRGF